MSVVLNKMNADRSWGDVPVVATSGRWLLTSGSARTLSCDAIENIAAGMINHEAIPTIADVMCGDLCKTDEHPEIAAD